MPGFQTEVRHDLGKDEAKQRLSRFVERLREQYAQQVSDVEGTWCDDTLDFRLTTYGIKIAGKLLVYEDRVAVEGDIPFSAMMFKGKIADSIRQGLERALA